MRSANQHGRFEFDGYTLRPVEERDRALLEQWISRETAHAGHLTPDFYIGRAYALEDGNGYVLLFLRTDVTARLHMEFSEATTTCSRARMVEALSSGFDWLAARLRGNGIEEMVFDSQSRSLRIFATHTLGFEAMPNDLRRSTAPRAAKKAPEEAWQGVPQNSEEVTA